MTRRSGALSPDTTLAVDEFMAKLKHPCKAEVQALREVILAADPSIGEGVKWNSPSYRTREYFATTNLRAKEGIGVILHLGAKVRELPAGGVAIEDSDKLLKWLGKDRAMVEFSDSAEIRRKKAAFQALLRRWIGFV
jgi:hypothetical protein